MESSVASTCFLASKTLPKEDPGTYEFNLKSNRSKRRKLKRNQLQSLLGTLVVTSPCTKSTFAGVRYVELWRIRGGDGPGKTPRYFV